MAGRLWESALEAGGQLLGGALLTTSAVLATQHMPEMSAPGAALATGGMAMTLMAAGGVAEALRSNYQQRAGDRATEHRSLAGRALDATKNAGAALALGAIPTAAMTADVTPALGLSPVQAAGSTGVVFTAAATIAGAAAGYRGEGSLRDLAGQQARKGIDRPASGRDAQSGQRQQRRDGRTSTRRTGPAERQGRQTAQRPGDDRTNLR